MKRPAKNMKHSGLQRLKGARRKTISTSAMQLVETQELFPDHLLPLLVQPTMKGVDLLDWIKNNEAFIQTNLLEYGGLLFRNFEIVGPDQFQEFIEATSSGALKYRERSSPRSQVSGNIYTSTDHPADQKIFLHNENSYAHSWPNKIYFYCYIQPTEGGETPIADCRQIYKKITPAIRDRFEQKGIMYVRNYGAGLGLPWQEVFQTDIRSEVEQYCQKSGYEYEWKPDDGLRTRRVAPAVVSHPKTNEPIWFNHATFFHISTLDESIRIPLLAQFDEMDLPTNSYYGDGTPIEAPVLDHLREVYETETVAFSWLQGDILLLDNMLTAHGRASYRGERKILTGMADPLSHDNL